MEKAACEPASSSPDLLPTVHVAETCHSAEEAGDRREQQTASHPDATAAAVIRIRGASRSHNNEGN